MKKRKDYPFHSYEEEIEKHKSAKKYKLAFTDEEFLLREDLRSVRLLLEYKKAETILNEQHIQSTIVVCGSSRILPKDQAQTEYEIAKRYAEHFPRDKQGQRDLKLARKKLEMSGFYEAARQLAILISSSQQARQQGEFVILTGGGPGIMEAANRGALENNAKSLGLSIFLPTEEEANQYIPQELHIQFHYFAMRKMHFLTRARAIIFFPGGFGTLDELFETLTLIQTKKIKPLPILLYCKKYWQEIINFDALLENDVIAKGDLNTFQYVESVEEAWNKIKEFYLMLSPVIIPDYKTMEFDTNSK